MKTSPNTPPDLETHGSRDVYAPNSEAPYATSEFSSADYELRLSLTQALYDRIGYWLDYLDSYPVIVGAVSGHESRARSAAAMCFSQDIDGTRSLIFIEIDPLTQRRRNPPVVVEVDPWQPVPESLLSFQELLKAVAIADPSSAETRQLGIQQFGEIANSEAPD